VLRSPHATSQNAGAPYDNPRETRWTSTWDDRNVTWTYTQAVLQPGSNYAYFSYWSDFGPPGSQRPFYRDGVYQGDTTAAPEPGTMALVVLGIAGLLIGHRLRRRGD